MKEFSLMDYLKAGQISVSNLLLEHYQTIGLDNDSFIVLLQLFSFESRGNHFPDVHQLSERTKLSDESLYQVINKLLQEGFITLETRQNNGQSSDFYNLEGVYHKLESILMLKQEQTVQIEINEERASVFQKIEIEFGRSLSPIEMEMINDWLEKDHYAPELIVLALREAVINQAYSLKYIDRILLSWERKNIKTTQQVQTEKERFQDKTQYQNKYTNQEDEGDKPDIPLFDWTKPQ